MLNQCLTELYYARLQINNEIIERLKGIIKTYLSIDIVESENNNERLGYPVGLEFARIF
jgi:hypothetical protein